MTQPVPSDAVSRRTLTKGAITAVWAVPAVTFAAGAPAYAACSSMLALTSAAAYATTGNGVDSTRLNITPITLTNNGHQSAVNPKITLRIPRNTVSNFWGYEVAPAVTVAGSISSGSLTGNSVSTQFTADGTDWWKLVLTLSPALPPGQSRTLTNLQIGFRDGGGNVIGTRTGFTWDHAPFRRWGGRPFTMNNTATADNQCEVVLGPANVADTPLSRIDVPTGNTSGSLMRFWDDSGTWGVTGRTIDIRINDIWNRGRSSIGKITLIVEVNRPPNTNHYFYNQPFAEPGNWSKTDWEWISFNGNGGNGPWRWKFETKTLGYAPPGNSAGTTDPGPISDFDGPLPDQTVTPNPKSHFRCVLRPDGGSSAPSHANLNPRYIYLSASHASHERINFGTDGDGRSTSSEVVGSVPTV